MRKIFNETINENNGQGLRIIEGITVLDVKVPDSWQDIYVTDHWYGFILFQRQI